MISIKWGNPFHSVYTKLFLIIFATGILLFVGIGGILSAPNQLDNRVQVLHGNGKAG